MYEYGDLKEFGGFKIEQWQKGDRLGDPQTTIHRLSTQYDGEDTWADLLHAFAAQPGVEQQQGLVLAAAKLPNLRVLFFGDINQGESEVSWIVSDDLAPLLQVFPKLTALGARGGNSLRLSDLNLPELHTLVIEAGGVSAELVRDIMTAKLPSLDHLELYLGTEEYGATSQPDDLTPILGGQLFPKLNYLGLKNSDYEDQIAQMVAGAPVLDGLDTLDLSMGILTDEGGRALLGSDKLGGLKKLDLNYHWMTDDMVAQLGAMAERLGIEIDLSDQQEPEDDDEDWRYVALGE